MSATLLDSDRRAVRQAIEDSGMCLRSEMPSSWEISLPRDPDTVFTLELSGRWLSLHAPCPLQPPVRPVELLERNAGLLGSARFTLAPDGSPRIRADLPLSGSNSTLSAPVKSMCEDAALLHIESAPARRPVRPSQSVHGRVDVQPFLDTLREAGWDARSDDAGCCVALDTPDRPYKLLVRLVTDDRFEARVDVVSASNPPGLAVQAACDFMLHAGHEIRLISPVLDVIGDRHTFALAGRFDVAGAETHAAHVLSALSVALESSAEEIRILIEHEEAARVYARIHNLSMPRAPSGERIDDQCPTNP
jgi:hypothetical protein